MNMRAVSKSEISSICNVCGAVMFDVCLRCGNSSNGLSGSGVSSISDDTQSESVHEKKGEGKESKLISQVTEAETLGSIFNFESVNSPRVEEKLTKRKKAKLLHRKLAIITLALALTFLSGYAYWKYNQSSQDFISPVQISASGEVINSAEINEKTFNLNVGLNEGNFAKYNLAQFADSNKTLFIQMFGLEDYIKKFMEESLFNTIKAEFKIKDGDIDVYTSEKFALVYPDSGTGTWGLAVGVKNHDFIKEKLKVFDANKAAYEKLTDARKKSLPTTSLKYDSLFATLIETKSSAEGDTSEKEPYLLISNSKEFLDQMKELSEGNIPNLATSAVFAQSQSDLPVVGQIFVYKSPDNNAWNEYTSWIATKYEYVGIDKILQSLKSSIVVMYTRDEALKIVELGAF